MVATKSIAGPAKGSRGETRTQRGLQLFRAIGNEIAVYLDGTYSVPSKSEEGLVYHVDLEAETCECRDHEYRPSWGPCCHQVAATIYRAKHRNRSPFGESVPIASPRCRRRFPSVAERGAA